MSATGKWSRDFGSYAEFYQHAYGQHVTSLRTVGSIGASRIEAHQSAGDWSDAPTPDLTIAWVRSPPTGFRIDSGAGCFSGASRPDDAILIAPGAGSFIHMGGAHVCRAIAVPYLGLLSHVGSGGDALPQDGDFGPLHAGLLRDRELLCLLYVLWRETEESGPGGALLVDGLILQMVGHLLRLRDGASQPRDAHRGGLAPRHVRQITTYIDDHLASDISLAQLATLVGLSTFHLCRAFKRSTGLPPHRWRLRRRIERAREMLEGTDLPVTEVAAAVGYDDPSQLASAFRKALGVSPSQYRRERRS